MAKKIKIKPGKALTRQERMAIDEEIWKSGVSPYQTRDENGNLVDIGPDGKAIPVKGSEAQAALKKNRKPKAKK